MTENDLYAAIRAECGKLSASAKELESSDILREGNYVLAKIAERITIKKYRSITSTAHKNEYDVDASTVRVQRVFQLDGVDEEIMKLGNQITDYSAGTEYYDFPSLWVIRMSRKKRGLPRINFDFNPASRKLTIKPTPQEDGSKYWYLSIEKTDWTLAKLPSDFEMLLVTGTTWRCLEIVAMARSGLGGIHRDGGTVIYPASEIHKIASDRKDEFYQELKVKSMLYNKC